MERSPPDREIVSFRFVRASGRGEAAWAGVRNDPSVAGAKSREKVPLDWCSAVARRCPVGCPGGVLLVFQGVLMVSQECPDGVPVSSGVPVAPQPDCHSKGGRTGVIHGYADFARQNGIRNQRHRTFVWKVV